MNPLEQHQQNLKRCHLCPQMVQPSVVGSPVYSKILLIGQAPGDKEPQLGKPFAWTAGKTLFKWFESIGVDEELFRQQVYMAAVCRCFPGKNPKGGDRVPDKKEIKTCRTWLDAEIELLQPELIIAVGKLAISQFVEIKKLTEVIGQTLSVECNGLQTSLLALPHPSGASTWHRMEPGKSLLATALSQLEKSEQWQAVKQANSSNPCFTRSR